MLIRFLILFIDSVAVPQPRSVLPNVQLSPRSAAFVSQNNDILNRRKVYGSPDRDRSRSPVTPPSRYTPGRWSLSPPPYNNVNLRPNNFEHRSASRSPPPPQIFRRSPMANSKSPLLTSIKSRSPLPLKLRKSPLRKSPLRKSPLRKSLSRSPRRMGNDRHLSPQYSRNRSPIGKYNHNQKNYRRYSPSQNRPYNRKQQNVKRSQSPRNNGHHSLKRSKSPINNSKRSRSKSPNRNYPSRPHRVERTGVNKRRSPPYNRKSNRGTNRSRRKPTSPNHSPSPVNKRKVEKSQNASLQSAEDKTALPILENNKIEKIDDLTTETKPENENENLIENVDNEMSRSSDDDKSSDEDDGIDLFASEESESENEGRFKSNSSKNVKPNTVATLSFTKLGNATTSTLGDLNEVKSDKVSTSSHRDDRYKRTSNYSNRKEDRNRKYGNNRNDDRYGEARTNYKSRYPSSAASVVPKVVDDKKKEDKLMFKSTFQVLQNELKSGELTLHFYCSDTRIHTTFLQKLSSQRLKLLTVEYHLSRRNLARRS